jgi:hypothetical protein
MKIHLSKIMMLLIGGTLAVSALPVLKQSGQSSNTSNATNDLKRGLSKHSALPLIAEFEEGSVAGDEERERRQRRQHLSEGLYSRRISDPGANDQSETIDVTFIDEVKILKPGKRPDPPGLPISSKAVLIGTVESGKAYVSEDHTYVYSEYKIVVNDVLKADSDCVISIGSEITSWRPGGSVRFHSGHVKHFITAGRGFPELGTQYLFFLRRPDPDVFDYAIPTAFALKDQVVIPMDDRTDQNEFEGVKSIDFLDRVRKLIAEDIGGGKK